MRRSSLLLSICLVFALAAPASAAGTFRLETADFTLTVPGLSDDEVTAETGAGTVSFYHTASQENGGGLIGTLVTVTPRCAVFSPAYTQPAYRIVVMGTDRAFLWRSPGGGVNCGPETLARDLKWFKKAGYKAKEAWGVDMFPMVEHVETVALLTRKAQ